MRGVIYPDHRDNLTCHRRQSLRLGYLPISVGQSQMRQLQICREQARTIHTPVKQQHRAINKALQIYTQVKRSLAPAGHIKGQSDITQLS